MNRYLKALALVAVLGVVATACRSDGGGGGGGDEDLQRGGIMRLSMISDVEDAFDPQKEYYQVSWGLYRCCMLRTLVSYAGAAGEDGGNDLVPDLAESLPQVSDDGLTWTFTLRDGITFGPPYADQEIVAGDFINAMEREADPDVGAGYPFYYSVIEGFDEYSAGEADTISGMTAIDDKTLEITLTGPFADLGFRMAMPAAAPIPDGAADGHEEDYGRFLVPSGPYMFEGSDALEPGGTTPVSGYQPGQSIVLVRNPSWDASTDEIRPAYVDRFEIEIGGTDEDIFNKIDAGELDLHLDGVPPAQLIRKFQQNPDREDQVFVNSADGTRYLAFNLAAPPFDDIHVRKASNFVLDRDGMRRIRGGELVGELARHIIPESLIGDKLVDYDPYNAGTGDVEAAMEEMRQSKYDTDGDGLCDAPACKGVIGAQDEAFPYSDQNALLLDNFSSIGIELDIKSGERSNFMYARCQDPGSEWAICLGPGWGKDYSDATTFGEPLFGSAAIGPDACCNYSLVGAAPDLLADFKYDITEVPGVDAKLKECDEAPVSDERLQCWADVDTELMENVVPWVPYLWDNDVFVVSDRLLNYRYDQFSGQPAMDHMALADAGAEA
ncbi:MAG TPA: ABC transporter substrate-binding protein [Actinomycetota bacterium]